MTDEDWLREVRRAPVEADSCRTFWAAVLLEGLRTAFDNTGIKLLPLDSRRARRWIESRDFDLICQFVGRDPDDLRRVASRRDFAERMRASRGLYSTNRFNQRERA